MPLAKDLTATTYDFLLGTLAATLDRELALLAALAATAADGSAKQTRELLAYALSPRGRCDATRVREALLEVAPLAGVARAEAALAILGDVAREAQAPPDPFAAILEPLARPRDEPDPGAKDEVPAGDGRALFAQVHGERAARVRQRLEGRSISLARVHDDVLYGGAFARPGLSLVERVVVAIGAVQPLDARPLLEDFVHAARAHGVAVEALWALADLLARLMKEAPEVRSATAAFEAVLGRRVRPLD